MAKKGESKKEKESKEILEREKDIEYLKGESKEIEIKESENESKNSSENTEKNIEKQGKEIKWVLLVGGIIVFVALFGVWIMEESRTFDYGGLSFHKEMFGKIPLYVAPVSGYGVNGLPINFNLALRYDPRKLNIPVNGTINFLKEGDKYVSIDTKGIEPCDNSTLSTAKLGMFLSNIGVKITSAVTDRKVAKEINKSYIDCSTNPENTIIMLISGNETKIEQNKYNQNCYTIMYKDCEVLQVVERFEMAFMAQVGNEEL